MLVETTSLQEEMFEELWNLYPRKKGKKSALIKYVRLLEKYSHEDLLDAVKNFAEEKKETEITYIPHGNKFFFEHYLDYLPQNYVKESKPKFKPTPKVICEVKGYSEYLKAMMTMPYGDYLETDHWFHFKKEAIKFFGHKCQLCNSNTNEIHIHHKTYENRGRETFNDVIPLCDGCHKLVHNK